jgi:hypothetical protein
VLLVLIIPITLLLVLLGMSITIPFLLWWRMVILARRIVMLLLMLILIRISLPVALLPSARLVLVVLVVVWSGHDGWVVLRAEVSTRCCRW